MAHRDLLTCAVAPSCSVSCFIKFRLGGAPMHLGGFPLWCRAVCVLDTAILKGKDTANSVGSSYKALWFHIDSDWQTKEVSKIKKRILQTSNLFNQIAHTCICQINGCFSLNIETFKDLYPDLFQPIENSVTSQKFKFCEIMGLISVFRKDKMKKAPLLNIRPVSANWWGDISTSLFWWLHANPSSGLDCNINDPLLFLLFSFDLLIPFSVCKTYNEVVFPLSFVRLPIVVYFTTSMREFYSSSR